MTGSAGRFLVLGASRLQIPLIRKARERGFRVAVVDQDSSAPGVAEADQFFLASTMDVDAVVEAARSFHPTAVGTMATDGPMRAVAEVAAEWGLPGPDVQAALRSTDKASMASVFHQSRVPHPRSVVVSSTVPGDELVQRCAGLEFPLVFKPTRSSGSRGVSRADDFSELTGAMAHASRYSSGGEVIVQEYIEGPEVSVEVLCFGGQPHVIAVTDKYTTDGPYYVEMGHRQPTALSEPVRRDVEQIAVDACASLGLDNCGGHVEIRVSPSGPKVIEAGARLGGGLIASHLTPLATGVDLVGALVDVCSGGCPDLTPSWNHPSLVAFLDAHAASKLKDEPESRVLLDSAVVEVEGYETGSETVRDGTDRSGHVVISAHDLDSLELALATVREALGSYDPKLEDDRHKLERTWL